jgi:hypothetical protein
VNQFGVSVRNAQTMPMTHATMMSVHVTRSHGGTGGSSFLLSCFTRSEKGAVSDPRRRDGAENIQQ